MDRTYLHVPPEESAAVRSAGAHWDERLKCWYLDPGADLAGFARWLGADSGPADLSILSDEACVAAATVPCSRCREQIEVICIHCKSGTVSGEPLTQFTVVDVLAVDDALARQLAPWPGFRQIVASDRHGPRYANHCLRCGAEQDDRDLHDEPGDPFFDISHAAPGSLRLIPLAGRVRLSGDEHFTIE
ncbi:MAG TPA: DUF5710 domain-containing protein [Steroidobacteraceae bacterium]|nr:DUF5710 domain-containing protein [Steroidobacteraceae bacterium]